MSTRNSGFSLVEVLVAVVLLSIGLLGLAKLQFWGVRHTGSAYFRTQATQVASEIVERLRANPIGVAGGSYELNPDGCKPAVCPISQLDCRGESCEPEELAAFDLNELACGVTGEGDQLGVDDLLPDGGMRVSCSDLASGEKVCRIEVCWSEAEAPGESNGVVALEVVP